MVILVAGGTGKVGSAVVQALSASGVDTRVLSRDPLSDSAKKLAELPGVGIVQGDLEKVDSLTPHFQGVSAAFLSCANFEGQVAAEKNFIDACATAHECQYVVKLGTINVGGYTALDSKIQYACYHAEIEAHLAEAKDLQWTVLNPNFFMQNHMGDIFGTLPHGVISYPLKASSRCNHVDVRDVGDVAARLLLLDSEGWKKHHGQKYHVCGPRPVSTENLAALYSKALGRPITPTQISAEDWIVGAEKAGFPPWLAKAVSYNFTGYWDKGQLSYKSSPAVLDLCAPHRTMAQWVQEHAPLSPPPVLKKPKFVQVKEIEPEAKGVNVMVKVVKSEKADDSTDEALTVVVGDASGVITLKAVGAQVAACTSGASVRIQNARCAMIKGHMELRVDKFGVVKRAESDHDFEPNTSNDLSATEYELS